MSRRLCPVCKAEYENDGDSWKFCCYDCYKTKRFLINSYDYPKARRIKAYGYKADVYLSHPSVTKEEMDAWIAEKKLERGWGVEEFNPERWSQYKIWVNSTNYD